MHFSLQYGKNLINSHYGEGVSEVVSEWIFEIHYILFLLNSQLLITVVFINGDLHDTALISICV